MKKIPLTQNKFAIVDDEDYEYLNQRKWCFDGRYAVRNSPRHHYKRTQISMHRFIMTAPDNMQVDHKNLNRLDNRKANLRLCTPAQNSYNANKRSHNKSGYKGVSWVKSRQKYLAQIHIEGKTKNLGRFVVLKEAVKVYNESAKKHYGEFARLNQL